MKTLVIAIVMTGLSTSFTGNASAACFSDTASLGRATAARPMQVGSGSQGAAGGSEANNRAFNSIVGMWTVTFLIGAGPDVFDVGFQQWHSDHTEIMVDNAVPPSLGNVCVGVWKLVGPRTYRLRHMTFNWNADGSPAGTFVLTMTVRLNRRGSIYEGSYAADSFDLSGVVIPALHVEGLVRATRITVD
jgi:hypothetical protein